MLLKDLVKLVEMPEYIDRELAREEPEQRRVSMEAFDREYQMLSKYNVNTGGEVTTVVTGIRNDKAAAISGELRKDEKEDRWYVEIQIQLEFHNGVPTSELKGNVIQVDVVIASPSIKSQGQGYNLYKALIDNGYTLLSDNCQYIGGRKLWDKVIRKAVGEGYKVYVLKGEQLIRDANGNPIAFDGSNIPHDQIWGKPGSLDHHHTLLVATKSI